MTGLPADPLLLAIDASTYSGSVAVLRGADVLAARVAPMRGERSEHLMPAVAGALHDAGLAPDALGGIVCGAGPGSFTSLRIAGSIAKGIASAESIPLYSVSSLLLMVAALDPLPAPGRYLALLDALRGEAYAQLVSVGAARRHAAEVRADEELGGGAPVLVRQDDVDDLARSLDAVTVGAGRTIDAVPHARGAGRLLHRLSSAGPVDLSSWEPDYGRLAEAQVRWEAAHGRPLPRG